MELENVSITEFNLTEKSIYVYKNQLFIKIMISLPKFQMAK